jgi:oligopeptide/dipeptide ABC transporter ATP-binding protein
VNQPPPLLELRSVSKAFPVREGILQRVSSHVHAMTDVSLTIGEGETLGLVGESGSGKSTLGRVALRLIDLTSGSVSFAGEDITHRSTKDLFEYRRQVQVVFQDPYSSFDPLLPLRTSVAEPLEVHLDLDATARRGRLNELMDVVGLAADHLERYPSELSGGQLQRMAVARALASGPRLVVLDEPVSSLDVSTQAQVINLLTNLQRDLGMSYLFIAHNPALVRHSSDRIAVMYLGEIVELGTADEVYSTPRHPYTEALLSAMMVPDPDVQQSRQRIVLEGDIPNPAEPPPGCRFHTRCPYVMDVCRNEAPLPFVAGTATVRCHLHTSGPTLDGAPMASLPMPTRR